MKTVRILSVALKLISVFAFGVSLFFGSLFYGFYLKWVFRFENGRYFDPMEVVYEDDSLVLGIFSLFLLLVSVVLWLVASKLKSNAATRSAGPAFITEAVQKTKDSHRSP